MVKVGDKVVVSYPGLKSSYYWVDKIKSHVIYFGDFQAKYTPYRYVIIGTKKKYQIEFINVDIDDNNINWLLHLPDEELKNILNTTEAKNYDDENFWKIKCELDGPGIWKSPSLTWKQHYFQGKELPDLKNPLDKEIFEQLFELTEKSVDKELRKIKSKY